MHEPNDDPWLPKLFQEVVLPYVLKFVVCHADAVEARVTVAIAASTIFFIVSLLSLSLFVCPSD